MPASLSEMRLHPIDFAILIGYLATLIGVGIYHARQQKNLNEYFLAGQEIRWLAIGLSLMAALNSGLDYLMQPGAMIKYGVYTMVGSLSWLVLYPYVFYVTLPMYRRLGVTSAYEYLERRFDVKVRTLVAIIFVIWRMGWMATALYVPSLAISVASGGQIPIGALVITLGLVITCYTLIGGIRAVIWNDMLQCCIMLTGLAVTVWLCISHTEGGIQTIFSQFGKVGQEAQVQPPPGAPTGWLSYFYVPMTFVGFLIAILMSRVTAYTGDQIMVQRCQTARSINDARRGFIITAVSDTVWMLSLSFVGLALFAFFNANFGGMPSWADQSPDQVFPYFISQVFPVGLTGLVIAAILAASISSIDSTINAVTTVITVDFAERLCFHQTDRSAEGTAAHQRKLLRLSRQITFVVGIVGIGLSLNVGRLGSLLEINNKIIISFTGPMLGIFLLGMFTRRARSFGVLCGSGVGTLVTIFVAFQREIYTGMNFLFNAGLNTDVVISFLWPATFGFVTTFVTGYAFSLLQYASQEDSSQAWTWANVMRSRSEHSVGL